ncbi:glycoside hydrolase superfamily [Plectosphaerella plurivora]|uniref:chitinase n=1 Tax=Plectosphaerella plurivora TaxID=936078 RepID=A0A9P9A7U1_9PEZI|nr:glycoside hydrolase superfamily [Plectosphaerella plurivora]
MRLTSKACVLAVLATSFGIAECQSSDQHPLELASCSSSNPCDRGCCSQEGTCGFGEAFCGESCQSTCDAQAECGEYAPAGRQTCPLNLCCSAHGFCGTTPDFCGEGCQADCDVPIRPFGNNYSNTRTIGYYQSWANSRRGCPRELRHIDTSLLTHLNYAFALIGEDYRLQAMSKSDFDLWPQMAGHHRGDPSLKVSISVGGWAVRSSSFSSMAQRPASRSIFIKSVINFMDTYAFDGIDLYWEYPGIPEEGGSLNDGSNYVHLVREMREALGVGVEISVVIPSAYHYLRHYDLAGMTKYINWFNLKSYDMHGPNGGDNGWKDLKIQTHSNLTEIDNTLDLLWHEGVQPSQVVFGLAFYGRSFTLADPACTIPGCPIAGTGKPGSCIETPGILSIREIADLVDGQRLTPSFDKVAGMKWISWGNQWVSYDDEDTISIKTEFASKRCLGGTMVWALDYDIDCGFDPVCPPGFKTLTGASGFVSEGPTPPMTSALLG